MSKLEFSIPVEVVSGTHIFVMVPLREIDILSSSERWGKIFLSMCTFFLGIGLQNVSSPNPILLLWAGSLIASFVFGAAMISLLTKSRSLAKSWQEDAEGSMKLNPGQISVKPKKNE